MISSLTNFLTQRFSSVFSIGSSQRKLFIPFFEPHYTFPKHSVFSHVRFIKTMSSSTKFKGDALTAQKASCTQQRKQRNQVKLDPAAASHAASRIDVSVIGTGCRGTPRAILIQSIFSKYAYIIFYDKFTSRIMDCTFSVFLLISTHKLCISSEFNGLQLEYLPHNYLSMWRLIDICIIHLLNNLILLIAALHFVWNN